nr:G5 domain-containing protein [Bowdeniella nasicola]
MTKTGRHAAKPSLSARMSERVHEFKAAGPIRRKILVGATVVTLVAGSGAVAVTQTDLLGTTTDTAAPATAEVATSRDAAMASRDLQRLNLDDIERVTITVTVDGKTSEYTVPALSLAEALADAGIVVGLFDTVSVPLSQQVTEGLAVEITRGNTGMTSDEQVTDFETIEKNDPTLLKGKTKVEAEGRAGITRTTYRLTMNEGEETDRTALATVVVQEKQDRVVLIGTKEPTQPAKPAPNPNPGNPGPDPDPAPVPAGSARDIARGMLASYGWGQDQFQCLDTLWVRESNWNHRAQNPSSGAYGIPQALPGSKMATAGSDWRTNPATQIKWGLGYIKGRYGSPCAALNHSYARGWY